MLNRNILATKVAETEGKRVQVNIAQIKEVLRCALCELALERNSSVIALLNKVRKENGLLTEN